MLLDLPITNVRLQACHEDWQHMTPIEQGRHCQRCNRVVIDFTQSSATELAAAQAAAPDGRVCGRFRAGQLAPSSRPLPILRPKLRQFLLAAVLILVQGLTAGQAWAQIRTTPALPLRVYAPQLPGALPMPAIPDAAALAPTHPDDSTATNNSRAFTGYVEHMAQPRGGYDSLMQYLRTHLHHPADTQLTGRVYVQFVVDKSGRVTQPRIIKGLHPSYDAAVLDVIKAMPPWEPGTQNGRPISVPYTLPITFSLTDDAPLQPPPSRKRRR